MKLHKEVFEKSKSLKFETYLFHFITNCIKEIQGKIFAVERDFWNLLTTKNQDIPNAIFKYFGGITDDDNLKSYIKIPQVFIALPNYFPTFEEIVQYNFHPKEGEKSFPTLLYDPNRKIDQNNIEKYFDKRPMPKNVRSYSLYLLLPEYLNDFKEYVLQEFKSYIVSLQWWIL
ncbi:MAG: hypothetical protein ACFE8N_04725 [Promethearchaeota archaeon]